jgi:ubiquinone/menaquinone biosynthesis C-methylase UbiE
MKTHYVGHDDMYKKFKTGDEQQDWSTPKQIEEYLPILEKSLSRDYIPKSGKFLEMGCGAGTYSLWFAQRGYDVFGIDIAPAAIEWAKEKAKKQNLQADFRVGSVLDLAGFEDNFFDFVLDGHCLHCIIGEDRKAFLKSALRVLKPKGFFRIFTMCGEVTNDEWKKDFDPESRCMIVDDIARRYIGLADDILKEVKDAGFEIMRHEIFYRKDKFEQDDMLIDAIKP